MTNKNEIGRQCMFTVHMPTRSSDKADYHLVKERIHYEDGTSVPNIKYIKNYERPFWVTKKGLRNHNVKKSSEKIENTNVFYSTQSALPFAVARALDRGWSKDHLRKLASSPYVYGLDIPASSYIRKEYQDKYPNLFSKYTVAALDIETDVVGEVDEAIMATITMGNLVFTVVQQSFVKGFARPIEMIDKAMDKYLSEYVTKRDLKCETVLVDSEIDIWITIFKKLHEWKPDLVSIWNMKFEFTEFEKACARAKVDPAMITSDPSVPVDRRFYKFKEGPTQSVTASGVVKPINMANQWHSVITPASFYVVDAMCIYRQLRLAKSEEQSYALDYILDKELNISKLKFKEADKYKKLAWHVFMQTNYKIEYIIYNRFDVISMLELDERTTDCSLRFPNSAGNTPYEKFSSQPTKVCNRYNFYLLEKGYVLGSTGENMRTEYDKEILDLSGWIVTLQSHLQVQGLPLLDESDVFRTNIRLGVSDEDLASGYPTAEVVSNSSVETTVNEIIKIGDIPEETFRKRNMEITAYPRTSAVRYCVEMLGFPNLDEIVQHYDFMNQ